MKNLFLTISLSLVAFIAGAQAQWLQPVHDFGAFSEDLGSVDVTFKIVNLGNTPIRILDARATCGCTRPIVPKGEIAPGDTSQIRVTYIASGRPGRFDKKIYVKTSDNPSQQRTLTVKGTVIGSSATLASRYPVSAGPMRLKSSNAAFGEVTRGRLKTIFIEAYNMSADTLRPRLEDVPDFITASINPESVAPGEQTQITLTLQTAKVPEWGVTQGNFIFCASDSVPPVPIDYFTIINEDFSRLTPGERLKAPIAEAYPTRTDLGQISIDSNIVVEFEVKNSGQSPLMVRRLQAGDSTIIDAKISTEKIKPGIKAKVTVTLDPKRATTDFISARVLIINNDPENSLLIHRITAEITK